MVAYFASTPSASSAPLKPTDGLDPSISIAADAADGADGVMGSVLTQGRYPDCPCSQPPLATEEQSVRRKVCAPADQRVRGGSLWPARAGAGLQKVGCASGPLRSVGHDLSHKGRHRIGVDDVLNRLALLVRLNDLKGARGAKGALTGCAPEREVSHAQQPLEAHLRQHVQAMRGRIEKSAKDVRSRELELPPKRMLRSALSFGNRCER
jgi:hypothetical protein